MLERTRFSLRRFPDAAAIARAYHEHKVLLARDGIRAVLLAIGWTVRGVKSADRVLLSGPLIGIDRLLWFTAYLAARLFRKPMYVYSEIWIEPDERRYWLSRWLQRRLRRDAFRILVPGHVHRAYHIAAGVDPQRVVRIESIYCPRPGTARLLPISSDNLARPFTLLYVGRIIPLKGLERLLRIMTGMLHAGYEFRLIVVVGRVEQYMGPDPGYPERCRRLAAAIPKGQIEIHAHVVDLDRFYGRADLLVMPNLIVRDKVPAEAWGRVVEEALFHCLPVLSTDAVPAAVELIDNGSNGLVVPWGGDEHVQAALAQLIENSSRWSGDF